MLWAYLQILTKPLTTPTVVITSICCMYVQQVPVTLTNDNIVTSLICHVLSKVVHAGYPWQPATQQAAPEAANTASAPAPSGLAAAAARRLSEPPSHVSTAGFSPKFAQSALGQAVVSQMASESRQSGVMQSSVLGEGKDYTAASSAAAALPAVSLAVTILLEAAVDRQAPFPPVPANKGLAFPAVPSSAESDLGLPPRESLPSTLSPAAKESEVFGRSMKASTFNPDIASSAIANASAPAQPPSSVLKPVPANVSCPSFMHALLLDGLNLYTSAP